MSSGRKGGGGVERGMGGAHAGGRGAGKGSFGEGGWMKGREMSAGGRGMKNHRKERLIMMCGGARQGGRPGSQERGGRSRRVPFLFVPL